jgi:hypothetical protein
VAGWLIEWQIRSGFLGEKTPHMPHHMPLFYCSFTRFKVWVMCAQYRLF